MTFKTYSTYLTEYTIKVETYPYVESRNLIKENEYWWDHVQRKIKHKQIRENYSLESKAPNSLNYSFKEKLKTGNFSFLFHGENIVGYQGLLIMDEGKTALCHRMLSNPYHSFTKNLGLWTDIYLTWQIKCAYEMGCEQYMVAWNLRNYSRYKSHAESTLKPRFKHNGPNSGIFQKFNWIGKQMLFNVEQHVAVFDLRQEYVPSFIKTLDYKLVE